MISFYSYNLGNFLCVLFSMIDAIDCIIYIVKKNKKNLTEGFDLRKVPIILMQLKFCI